MRKPSEMTEEMRRALGGKFSGDPSGLEGGAGGRDAGSTMDPHALALAEAEARAPASGMEEAMAHFRQVEDQRARDSGRPAVPPPEPVEWWHGSCLAKGEGGVSFKVSDVYALP